MSFEPPAPYRALDLDLPALPDLDEPGPDQRWSTWPATTPPSADRSPHPAWLVTSAAAFDTEWGIVKTGKEADVFLIERAVPAPPGACSPRSATATRALRLPSVRAYEEGRRMRNSRDARAIERKSTHGRLVAAGHWAFNEFIALCRAWDAGIPVPYPVQLSGTELLMEFIGDGRAAAPRLAQSRLHGRSSRGLFAQVVQILTGSRAGFAHGDLSAYNLLVHRGRRDRPAADRGSRGEPAGLDFLHRDVVNVCTWFARRGLDADAEDVFAELVAQLW